MVFTPDGVEARIGDDNGSSTWKDFWKIRRDGTYYLVRRFVEDFEQPRFVSSVPHPAGSVWIELRMNQITEVLLYSAKLYGALNAAPKEPYLIVLRHGGLAERRLYYFGPRWHIPLWYLCRTPAALALPEPLITTGAVLATPKAQVSTQSLETSALLSICFCITNALTGASGESSGRISSFFSPEIYPSGSF